MVRGTILVFATVATLSLDACNDPPSGFDPAGSLLYEMSPDYGIRMQCAANKNAINNPVCEKYATRPALPHETMAEKFVHGLNEGRTAQEMLRLYKVNLIAKDDQSNYLYSLADGSRLLVRLIAPDRANFRALPPL